MGFKNVLEVEIIHGETTYIAVKKIVTVKASGDDVWLTLDNGNVIVFNKDQYSAADIAEMIEELK